MVGNVLHIKLLKAEISFPIQPKT